MNAPLSVEQRAWTTADSSSARAEGDDLSVLERHDHESLVVLGRPVPGKALHGLEERLLEDVRALLAPREDDAFEALEAERLAFVVERLDEAVAVEDEAVARLELHDGLVERLPAFHAQREAPRRQQLELLLASAEDVRVEMAGRREAQRRVFGVEDAEEERHEHALRCRLHDDVVQDLEDPDGGRVVLDLDEERRLRHRHHDAAREAVACDVAEGKTELPVPER